MDREDQYASMASLLSLGGMVGQNSDSRGLSVLALAVIKRQRAPPLRPVEEERAFRVEGKGPLRLGEDVERYPRCWPSKGKGRRGASREPLNTWRLPSRESL